MLGRVDARLERLQRVIGQDGDIHLGDNGTGIHRFVGHEMHHDPGMRDLAALIRLPGALDGVRAQLPPGYLLEVGGTVEDSELVDPTVGVEGLLYRLFHEHGVRVFPPAPLADRCTCSRERVMSILEGFSAEEVDESIEDGRIRVQCEFCSKAYEFEPAEIVPRRDR